MNMKHLSVEQLSELTAANTSAPGGGSISAMAGAFAASLVCMMAKLTDGKKGYEEAHPRMREISAQAEILRVKLLDLIQKDSESFDAYMTALTLPKQNEEEKRARSGAMQEALKGACAIPREVAECSFDVLDLALEAVSDGNLNALSDGLVGALMARSAILGAISNIRINLGGIKDEVFRVSMLKFCDDLEHKALQAEEQTIAVSKSRS